YRDMIISVGNEAHPCWRRNRLSRAGVAELEDALDLGSSAFGVGVRVPPPAPIRKFMRSWWNWQTRYLEGVVAVRPCEFESRRPHQIFLRPRRHGAGDILHRMVSGCGSAW